MCNGGGGAPGPCWQGGAEGPSVLEALSWRAWCGGGPGDGWAEVSLSKRFQISESLAEKREAVGEARPPRRVVRISEFHRRCDESVLLKLHWDKRRIADHVCAA